MKTKISLFLSLVCLGCLSVFADGSISYTPTKIVLGNEAYARNNYLNIGGFNALHWEYGDCVFHIQLANFSKVLISGNQYVDFYNHQTKTPCDIYCMWLMTLADPPRVETPDYYDDDDVISRIGRLQPAAIQTKSKSSSATSGVEYGFAGRNIKEVFPELCESSDDGRESYDAIGMISLLTKGVQQLTESVLENDLKLSVIKDRIASAQALDNCMLDVAFADNCLTVSVEDCGCENDLRKIHISSADGMLVKSFELSENYLRIESYDLTKGLTFVSLSANGKVVRTKKLNIDNR